MELPHRFWFVGRDREGRAFGVLMDGQNMVDHSEQRVFARVLQQISAKSAGEAVPILFSREAFDPELPGY